MYIYGTRELHKNPSSKFFLQLLPADLPTLTVMFFAVSFCGVPYPRTVWHNTHRARMYMLRTGYRMASWAPDTAGRGQPAWYWSKFLASQKKVTCTCTRIYGEGFSPLGETDPPKGEETALPTTLSRFGSADGSCPRSLLDLRGWGSSGGGALRKPSFCKQQSLNAKIRDEIIRS